MPDVHDKKQRSYNMSMIKSGNTKPEIIIRKFLRSMGLRGYRIKSDLPGKPDIVFAGKKTAVFIDGCFWHRCPECFVKPDTNKKFWKDKIDGNVRRDRLINSELEKNGWKVIRIWEHDVRRNPEEAAERIINAIRD